jgi:hypothetical protein
MPHPFDRLRYDVNWCVQVYLELFDAEAELVVRAEETGPEGWQRRIFDEFLKRQSELKQPVYEAVLRYYEHVAPSYREQYESREEGLRVVPLVNTVEGIRRTLTPPYRIYIGDVYPEGEELGILFECEWEYEHGVGVLLRHWEIVEVGTQDICL